MRKMKDSGIEWIGEIPSDWIINRIKFVADLFNGDRGKNYPSGDDLVDDGIVFLSSNNIHDVVLDVSPEKSKYITNEHYKLLAGAKIKINDIIYCLRGSVGLCAINQSASEGTIASSLLDIRPKNVSPKFLNYYLQSPANTIQTLMNMNGSCASNLSAENVANYYLIEPPINEQNRIANYLDQKCSEIDAITKDIQTQIDTLEQYKRSVITEAVTKGLDPNVEMKDSGIEWIGKIPSSWEVDKIKYHLTRKDPRNPGNVPVLSLYREYGIVLKDSRDDNHNVTSEDTSKYKYVRPNDFVINKMKAWQGSVAVSEYEGIVSPAYYVYHFNSDDLVPRYFHYLLRSCYKDEFRRLSGGIREGQWDLPSASLDNTLILLPPLNEQNKIAFYIDQQSIIINEMINEKKIQLSTLSDYKKSLIYEYVTGKKEVPVE